MNFVGSQLSKPPFPTFYQSVSALNDHEFRISSYEEEKTIDHKLEFVGIKGGRRRGRGHGPGFIPLGQHFGNKTIIIKNKVYKSHKEKSLLIWLKIKISESKHSKFYKGSEFEKSRYLKDCSLNIFQAWVYCQVYGKSNHTAQECWYRYDFTDNEAEVPQALAALSLTEVPNQNWNADIGVTAHMTNDLGNFVLVRLIKK